MHHSLNATMDSMQTVTRLINQFVPNNYQLSLKLNRLDRTFSGIVIIIGDSQPNSNTITLHSKDLDIKSIIVDGKNAEFSFSENDALVISHPDIVPGKHILVIDFSGKITDSMHGLYPCYYEHEGQKKELLATQFESHHAREVFPCIDEPEAKATFDVTLTTENNVVVLGNMPIKSQATDGDLLVTTFNTTPLMSSYLLAWVVGELHKKTAYTKSGVEVNVWATPAQPSNNLDFALDISTRTIDFFDEYFGIAYPLPKCDHVALPDFSSGAMENWGLITYREIVLLADPITTSISTRHHIATVIAHELSHQWFGNLVTMKWWNDLWLNESFATLVEYIAIDALEPNWNIWLNFATSESIAALRRDSLDGVQSVQTDVNHPDEIGTLFDGAIVYAKGARLLQMLQQYIGDAAFQAGLKHYFQVFAYKNTEAIDLWQSLAHASNKDIASLMTAWISQPGFPVLHASMQNDKLLIRQEKLTSDINKTSDTLWPIPLNSNCPEIPEILELRELLLTIDSSKIIQFNCGNNVHFITHYSPELMSKLIDQLKSGKLSPINRLQLLNEQTILARSGIISSAELVPLLDAYRDETNEAVWNIISIAIGELKKFVEDDEEAESKLKTLAISLASKQYQRLGWTMEPGEPETDSKLRGIALGLMVYGQDQNTINTAVSLFSTTPLELLDPELRALIIIATVKNKADDSVIDSLVKNYEITDSAELKQDISIGLTSTKNSISVTRFLDMLKDTTTIHPQDTSMWMIFLIRNKYARTQTWQWVRDNWDWIKQTFGGDKSYDDYPRYTASALMTRQQFDEYREFFIPLKSDPTLSRAIDMGINEIQNRLDTIEHDGPSVREALLNL